MMTGEQRYKQAATKARILTERNLRKFLAGEADWMPMSKDREFIVREFDRLHDEIARLRDDIAVMRKDCILAEDEWAKLKQRIPELQYEAGMYQCLYENAAKILSEINQIVHVPTKDTMFRGAHQHFQSDFDRIRKTTAPFA